MSLSLGNTTIGSIYLGSTKIGAAYLGNVKLYQSGDPYNPLGLPAYTIRCEFTEGVTPTFAYGTGVQVSASPNVWDLTYVNTSWNRLLRNQTDLLSVLGANSTGVTAFEYTFGGCSAMTDVALFDTTAVTTTKGMFNGCNHVTNIPLYDLSNDTKMTEMFKSCNALTSLPLFNTHNVTHMDSMCEGCYNLVSLPLFDTTSVYNVTRAFYSCRHVESGALALYNQMSSQTTPPTYYPDCFYWCGKQSTTGAAELAQIPTSWGGTMS